MFLDFGASLPFYFYMYLYESMIAHCHPCSPLPNPYGMGPGSPWGSRPLRPNHVVWIRGATGIWNPPNPYGMSPGEPQGSGHPPAHTVWVPHGAPQSTEQPPEGTGRSRINEPNVKWPKQPTYQPQAHRGGRGKNIPNQHAMQNEPNHPPTNHMPKGVGCGKNITNQPTPRAMHQTTHQPTNHRPTWAGVPMGVGGAAQILAGYPCGSERGRVQDRCGDTCASGGSPQPVIIYTYMYTTWSGMKVDMVMRWYVIAEA